MRGCISSVAEEGRGQLAARVVATHSRIMIKPSERTLACDVATVLASSSDSPQLPAVESSTFWHNDGRSNNTSESRTWSRSKRRSRRLSESVCPHENHW